MRWNVRKMSNFEELKRLLLKYFQENTIDEVSYVSNLHEVSINDSKDGTPVVYVYNGKKDLEVLDMDKIAQKGYKKIKGVKSVDSTINTADAFIINQENEWYFIEFKDSKLSGGKSTLKDNIIKKAYSNWYMMLDLLYEMREQLEPYSEFDFDNPIRFAKEHVSYILVCSMEKNPNIYTQIKNEKYLGRHYTIPFMQRLKDYLFKDAYVYTEDFFEREFVDRFQY